MLELQQSYLRQFKIIVLSQSATVYGSNMKIQPKRCDYSLSEKAIFTILVTARASFKIDFFFPECFASSISY